MLTFDYVLDLLARSPHLYALAAAYWALVATALVVRYARHDRAGSEAWLRRVMLLGLVAGAAAVVDVALRGPELVHLSLVAYLATPLGVGRLLVARWDGTDLSPIRMLLLRETTYVVAFLAFVALSVAAGDPWWFTAPQIDDSTTYAVLENTNWFHLMATAWGLAIVIDLVWTPVQVAGRRATGLLGASAATTPTVRSGRGRSGGRRTHLV